MPVAEWILTKIADAVFDYVLERANVKGRVTNVLGLDAERNAFKRALGKATTQLEEHHPQEVAELFDFSFLEHEGAAILAQFLIRDGQPSPSELAARWAD